MSTITLPVPKVITPAVVATTLTFSRIVDLPQQKIVRAFFTELAQPVNLWEAAAYDAIGNWTQEQAEARALELFAE